MAWSRLALRSLGHLPRRVAGGLPPPGQIFGLDTTSRGVGWWLGLDVRFYRRGLDPVSSRYAFNAWYITRNLGLATSEQTSKLFADLLFFAAPIVLLDVYLWFKNDLLGLVRLPIGLREFAYVGAICLMILFAVRTPTEFIYFQF